jgi:hypothetical protein
VAAGRVRGLVGIDALPVWDGDVAYVRGSSVFLANAYREMLMGCVNMVSVSDSSVLFGYFSVHRGD